LTEILREGLQSTITEINQPVKTVKATAPTPKRKPVQFAENKFADILNETDALMEQGPSAMNSFADLMNEGMDDTISMTSQDARGFGQMRETMRSAISGQPAAPKVMEDPESGKTFEVPVEVQQAMTRDYSALMKAMNKKKGN
jgi:hypothetical protein